MKAPLALVAVLLAAACGGDGGERLTKQQLIARGDAICADYLEKNDALNAKAPARSPIDPSATDDEVRASAAILRKLADNLQAQREELATLRAPAAVERRWEDVIDDLGVIASRLDDAADAAAAADRQQVVNLFSEILRIDRRVDAFGADYGFTVCGRPS